MICQIKRSQHRRDRRSAASETPVSLASRDDDSSEQLRNVLWLMRRTDHVGCLKLWRCSFLCERVPMSGWETV